MKKGGVSDHFRALIPVGTVEAVRQEYEVLRTAGGDYLVFSPSRRGSTSYHMTLVPSGKVEALAAAMGNGGVTAGLLMKDPKLEEAFGTDDKVAMRFDILIGLYVLTAAGRVEMRRDGRNLIFTKRTGRV
jgi:hypothetical protein